MKRWMILVAVALFVLSGCRGFRMGMGTKTALAVGAVVCAGLAITANTQISEDNIKDHNYAWGYGGVVSGIASSIIALIAMGTKTEPGTNWWDETGWGVVTGVGTAVASISGIVAIVRVGSMYAPEESGNQCVKGCPCGNSCIDCSKTCHK